MLVLSRQEEEAIILGDNIEIQVIRIDKHSVKLGIKAPKDVSIYRKEIYEAILKNNQVACVPTSATALQIPTEKIIFFAKHLRLESDL